MLGGEREQRVLDAVVGQDHQRTLGAQPLREDPGGCRTHLLQGVLVGDRRPRRIGAGAIGDKNPVRRLPRPMLQPVADATRTRLKRHGRLHQNAAVGAAVGDNRRRREQIAGIVTACGGEGHGFLLSRVRDCRASCRPAASDGPLAPNVEHNNCCRQQQSSPGPREALEGDDGGKQSNAQNGQITRGLAAAFRPQASRKRQIAERRHG